MKNYVISVTIVYEDENESGIKIHNDSWIAESTARAIGFTMHNFMENIGFEMNRILAMDWVVQDSDDLQQMFRDEGWQPPAEE